jgi:hypothetical protein
MIKPEKLVEISVRGWCYKKGFFVQVFDSKATFSLASKSYKKNKGLPVGTPDIIGVTDKGIFLAIELKAPKKDHICSLEQHKFLSEVILRNGFACVVSSVEKLEHLYNLFLLKKDYKDLLNALPTKVYIKQGKTRKIIDAPKF